MKLETITAAELVDRLSAQDCDEVVSWFGEDRTAAEAERLARQIRSRGPGRPIYLVDGAVVDGTAFLEAELNQEAEAAAQLYRDGKSIAGVAAALGVSDGVARRRLLAAGVELRRPGRGGQAETLERILEVLEEIRDELRGRS